jgi:hypothetical protein
LCDRDLVDPPRRLLQLASGVRVEQTQGRSDLDNGFHNHISAKRDAHHSAKRTTTDHHHHSSDHSPAVND